MCHRFEKDDGICSNYHLRANPELLEADHRPNVIAMRRFPCLCASCVSKMMEPIETRCTGPSDTCIYWEIFKKPDGISGYNDWKLIKLKPKDKVYNEEDDIAQLKISTHQIGVRMADQVKVGGFCGYIADDDRYDYYIFKCTDAATVALEDKLFQLDGNEFLLKKGQHYYKGV